LPGGGQDGAHRLEIQTSVAGTQFELTRRLSRRPRGPMWPLLGHGMVRVRRREHSSNNRQTRAADGDPLTHPLPGQFVTVRLPAGTDQARPVLRSYSLSGPPDAAQHRISVKLEPNGVASTCLHTHARVGDILDVTAPSGNFVIDPLTTGMPDRPWLYGARNALEHPFADEVRTLLGRPPNVHACVCYSQPGPHDRQPSAVCCRIRFRTHPSGLLVVLVFVDQFRSWCCEATAPMRASGSGHARTLSV
jgi:hypothetical protein